MLRHALFLIVVFAATSFADLDEGAYCGSGDGGLVDKIANTCSPLIYGEKTYCCLNIEKGSKYCCNSMEYFTQGAWFLAAIIAGIIVIMMILSCLSCLCCTCCPWYRRRHRGTVYGKVQGPRIVQVIQQPGNVVHLPPARPNHTAYAYPANQTAMPYPPAQSSPQYTTEAYSKQAPYNPNYAY